jgi:hypothetical protein
VNAAPAAVFAACLRAEIAVDLANRIRACV